MGGSTPDSIVGLTLINADGDIKTYDHTHPDLPIFAACLGLCGIILQVTVRYVDRFIIEGLGAGSYAVQVGSIDTLSSILSHFLRPYPTHHRFSVDTSAVQVTSGRRPFHELFPPRGTPINESFNPLKQHISVAGKWLINE